MALTFFTTFADIFASLVLTGTYTQHTTATPTHTYICTINKKKKKKMSMFAVRYRAADNYKLNFSERNFLFAFLAGFRLEYLV